MFILKNLSTEIFFFKQVKKIIEVIAGSTYTS